MPSFFFIFKYVYIWIYVKSVHMNAVCVKARREHLIPWKWSYMWLWATKSDVGHPAKTLCKTICALQCWAICPGPQVLKLLTLIFYYKLWNQPGFLATWYILSYEFKDFCPIFDVSTRIRYCHVLLIYCCVKTNTNLSVFNTAPVCC